MNATMHTIADYSMFTKGCQLGQKDVDYIRSSQNQYMLMFPVDNRVTDRLALLHFFKEASQKKKFLMSIQIKNNPAPGKPAL